MATPLGEMRNFVSLGVRAALPIVILAGGWWGFSRLAIEVEEPPPEAAEVRTLRTRVKTLEVTDYPVSIKTNAVVQAHNQVTMTAEVAGTVVKVSPAFEVGAYFSEGEVLVEIDSRNYATGLSIAQSRLEAAKSALELARLDEQRKLRLIERDAVSRAEVDVASATREQAEADVNLARAEVDRARLDLLRTKVVAPFDGRVQAKSIGLGQMANPNTPLGEIFAVDFAEVRLPISARQRQFLTLPELADDPPVNVVLRDAISTSNEALWHAKIVRTEGIIDQDSRDLFAIARIDDPFGLKSDNPPLRIGQPVNASIEGKVLRNVVALPRGAVRQLDQVVLVNPDDQTLMPLVVQSIWSDAEHVVVEGSALPTGMWLATSPMVYTPAGAKVEIIPEPSATATIADCASGDAPDSATN
jgi:RND family efflux transporter MFP subunit